MTDDEQAAWMTPPPNLVRGCDSPEGVRILADWLDEHGGDGSELREQQRDVEELPTEGWGDPYGNEDGTDDLHGNGFEMNEWGHGDGRSYGEREGDGAGDGYGSGESTDGHGKGDWRYGTMEGDGGIDLAVDGGIAFGDD